MFGVMVVIRWGTVHGVADVFYFWMGGAFTGRGIVCLLAITLGNAVGGVLFPLLRDLQNK